jgi:hypothetical protein
MQSMSEPKGMTGLPEPQEAIQAVGIPATPRSIWKPSFSRMLVRYREMSRIPEIRFRKTKDGIDHHLRPVRHALDLASEVGAHRAQLIGRLGAEWKKARGVLPRCASWFASR